MKATVGIAEIQLQISLSFIIVKMSLKGQIFYNDNI